MLRRDFSVGRKAEYLPAIASERVTMSSLFRRTPARTSGPEQFLLSIIVFCASIFANVPPMLCQPSNTVPVQIRYDETRHTFRMDAADVSYIFGVNQSGALQTLYWGKRLRSADAIPEARLDGGTSAFDLPVNATPQEFTGWGGGLVVVPDLKITFPDGNRDLALDYVSHTIHNNALTVVVKDISRDVFVELQYEIDPETGVLARSARVENRTHESFTIEQAFAAT